MIYKIDEKTQKMLQKIAEAKLNLDHQMQVAIQVLLNTFSIPDERRVTITPDFSSLKVEDQKVEAEGNGGHA